MNTAAAIKEARAVRVRLTDDDLVVELADGRIVSVPISWYPRLAFGTRDEREHVEIIGNGIGLRWPSLDEDISVEGILAGRRSGEGRASLGRWKDAMERRRQDPNPGAWGESAPLPGWWYEKG